MSNRKNISSGSPWEDVVGYSRAVRIGNLIEVAGTTSMDGNTLVGAGSVYEQTRFILQKIEKALNTAGAGMQDVVRTRIFLTDISKWEEAGRAHGEVFQNIKPASTMVEVSALIDQQLLVEIEATAYINQDAV
jgi:enamine deaminase RidA (YjgF/YER057c/UK114 family)